MKNLGSINNKVEVCTNDADSTITLASSCNIIELTKNEALDLGDVMTYAATGQMHLLPSCSTWIPNKETDNATPKA